ncbi:MAG TPA: winged helix DNA-binding domain-containing protein [Puia sp.]|nr:winged helix DNA-binding domain-containing protein [Puia sp.]
MKLSDIPQIRLLSQQIASTSFKTSKEIVSWMCAMQAQDYNMAKWAIGCRVPGLTENAIENAIDKGEIIRTHLLRPTWHFVDADDISWILALSGPRLKASLKGRQLQMELTETIFKKSNQIIEKALLKEGHLTRDELVSILKKAKMPVDNPRGGHLFLRAELDALICSGRLKGKKNTYALFSERIPAQKKISRDDALAKLAKKYFTSHCPATIPDFTWWSGLTASDARNALEMIKPNLISEKIGSEIYWMDPIFSNSIQKMDSVHLLPAFDEFLISYSDRAASLSSEHHHKALTQNGIFRPVIIINGKVCGLWKRSLKKNKIVPELNFFKPPAKKLKSLIRKASGHFTDFLNQEQK